MKKEKKILLGSLIFIIIMIIFFSYSPVITFDTSHYLWLENMLTKNASFAEWDPVRGIVFPLMIFCSNALFGHDADGILMMMFIFYIVMLAFVYFTFKQINREQELFDTKRKKIILIASIIILIMFNPIVYGFYHTLLTEFIAITIAVVMCYLSWNWIECNFKENKAKYILYIIVFSIATIFAWHLKQPYVSAAIFPIIIATIISICRNFNWKNILQRVMAIIVCLILLFVSLKVWNKILEIGNVQLSADREASGFVTNGLIDGVTQLEEEMRKENADLNKIDEYKISDKNKNEVKNILNGQSKYNNFIIYNNKNENAKDIVIFIEGNEPTMADSIEFFTKTLFTTPITLIKSYINNYLCIINIFEINFEGVTPKVTSNFTLFGTEEISAIGLRIYNTQYSNLFDLLGKYQVYADAYKSDVEPIRIINVIIKLSENIIILITKIAFLLLPITLIVSIIISIKNRKKMNINTKKQLNIIIILLSFSILHVLLHSVLGACIDRYTVPAMVTMFMAYIIIFYAIAKNKSKNNKKKC